MRGNLYFLSTRDEEDIFTRDITLDANQSKNIQDRKLFCLGLTALLGQMLGHQMVYPKLCLL